MDIGAILLNLWADSGFTAIASGFTSATGWQSLIMLVIACVRLHEREKRRNRSKEREKENTP